MLLILGVILSSGGLWKGLRFHRREWFSRFHESDLSSSWRLRRIQIRKMSSWRMNLRLRKHLFKLVCYLKTCGAWLAWHLLPHQSSWDYASSPATIHSGQVRRSVLGATPRDSELHQPCLSWEWQWSQVSTSPTWIQTQLSPLCPAFTSFQLSTGIQAGPWLFLSWFLIKPFPIVLWERKFACK